MPKSSLLDLTSLAVLIAAMTAMAPWACAELTDEGLSERRAEMIRAIEADVRATRRHTGRSELDRRVMEAMARVPRHEFVAPGLRDRAYDNRPLPIGQGQTISQPYIVALMTDLLELGEDAIVLDIGTGSGYQAAILAELAERVYSIEIIPELGREAAGRLARLGYENVEVRIGDGYFGWPEQAPFDGILIAAAIDEIPRPLIDQMRNGSRLILPHGDPARSQDLMVLEKTADGQLEKHSIIPVRFVPLTGDH